MEVSSWENHLSINIFSQQAIFDFYIDYIDYIDLYNIDYIDCHHQKDRTVETCSKPGNDGETIQSKTILELELLFGIFSGVVVD
jgi:hypothetical protein